MFGKMRESEVEIQFSQNKNDASNFSLKNGNFRKNKFGKISNMWSKI